MRTQIAQFEVLPRDRPFEDRNISGVSRTVAGESGTVNKAQRVIWAAEPVAARRPEVPQQLCRSGSAGLLSAELNNQIHTHVCFDKVLRKS